MANVSVASHNAVDVASKFCSFIFVDGVCNVGVSALDPNLVLVDVECTLIPSFLEFRSQLPRSGKCG